MVNETAPPTSPLPRPSGENAPGATASLVLGILSICCFWIFTAIPAIIMGASARKKVALSGGALGGDGLALGGIITGSVGIIAGITPLAIVASIALPAFMGAKNKAEQARTTNELRQISMACQQYAIDNNGAFPSQLQDLFPDYIDVETILTYEDDSGGSHYYRYRSGLSIESGPQEPLILGPEDDSERLQVGYVDGSIRPLYPGESISPEVLAEFE